MDDVKFKIANRLTSVLDSARQNVERTSNEVKQSFIDKLSSKIAEF
jgi:phage terminase Nu1 subunit (DNA packaging protein)